ncbi:ferrochelatase [Saccharopolyspora erythraea]|uniref:ferrochelatase n=1 Tax=Saccharopolyspora erythraea TaxID=1836 RepID=UPI001BAB899A|nr:ferrochelatase [Saccharopolyspora erythraea]QUH02788.1 ferrochelatase [Saccharopolyspora erythraea]
MSFDALLFLSFGGPEGPEDVRPFLENVTRGRGVPPERLDEVAEHYLHFGGVSPINRLNRDMIKALETELADAGIELPVYFGNRNWHPMVEDTVARMAEDGVGRALVFATSAWGGYSGCKQYHEDIVRARESVGERAPELVKLRQFFDHPEFVAANADAVRRALAALEPGQAERARLVFTAHSVPLKADEQPGADGRPQWYSRQVAEASKLVAEAAGVTDYDVVWQSRSGPPQVPWLEPDIVDHIEALHGQGTPAVVVSPIGFVSDHLEVIWDLDNEAKDKAAELGMGFARADTAGTDPRFAKMIVELAAEHLSGQPPRKLSLLAAAGCSTNGETCAPGCC